MTPRLKCLGLGCPLARECWRAVAPALPYTQCYIVPRFDPDTASCPDQWPVHKHDRDVLAGRVPGDYTLPTGAAHSSRGNGWKSE